MPEQFTARLGDVWVRWEDGVFSSNFPPMLAEINDLIAAGEFVPSLEVGPLVKAAASPGYAAYYTAYAALESPWEDDLFVWDVAVDFAPVRATNHPGALA